MIFYNELKRIARIKVTLILHSSLLTLNSSLCRRQQEPQIKLIEQIFQQRIKTNLTDWDFIMKSIFYDFFYFCGTLKIKFLCFPCFLCDFDFSLFTIHFSLREATTDSKLFPNLSLQEDENRVFGLKRPLPSAGQQINSRFACLCGIIVVTL